MKEIINCCLINGTENPSYWCAEKCGLYIKAKSKADSKHPYLGTGYGNLYGEVSLASIRAEARRTLARIKKS